MRGHRLGRLLVALVVWQLVLLRAGPVEALVPYEPRSPFASLFWQRGSVLWGKEQLIPCLLCSCIAVGGVWAKGTYGMVIDKTSHR